MRKLVTALTVVGALAVPAISSAAAPDGSFVFKDNVTYNQGNLVGQYSSRIIQNGQFVSGQVAAYDQTTYPGSRADAVQLLLGH